MPPFSLCSSVSSADVPSLLLKSLFNKILTPQSLHPFTISISVHCVLSLLPAMAIYKIPRYLAGLLTVSGIVSGQYVSSSTSTTTAIPTPTLTVTPTTSTSAMATVKGCSVTNMSASSSTTSVFYYCTPPASTAIGPFVTVYNTVYIDVCPTGITSVTYTISDTCGCTHSSDYVRPTGCPSGFTVTEKTCTACPGTPVITVTTPIAPASQTTNSLNTTGPLSVTPISIGGQNSSPQSEGSLTSGLGTKPSYFATSNAQPAAGISPLDLIMVISMAAVTGLVFTL